MAGKNPQDYAEFNSFIKDLATKALRLNAGVQTDSDYKRQLEAMISGASLPRDKDTAVQLIDKITNDFNVSNQSSIQRLDNVRAEYGGEQVQSQQQQQFEQQQFEQFEQLGSIFE